MPRTVTYTQTGILSSSGQHHSGLHDGNLTTPWSDNRKDAWITYDLGGVLQVNTVSIAFSDADNITYQFSIEVSQDTQNWTHVFTGNSKKGEALQEYTFKTVDARYVKLIIHENNSPAAPHKASVTELVVGYDANVKGKAAKSKSAVKEPKVKVKKETKKKDKAPVKAPKKNAVSSSKTEEQEDVDEGPMEKHSIPMTQEDFKRANPPLTDIIENESEQNWNV